MSIITALIILLVVGLVFFGIYTLVVGKYPNAGFFTGLILLLIFLLLTLEVLGVSHMAGHLTR